MKVTLKTLTPLHIGSGEKYPPCNLVVLKEEDNKKTAVRLNTRKFLEVLRKRPQITKELSKTLTLKEVENVEDGVFYEVSLYSDFSSGKRNPEIPEVVHHPDGSVYIPGSSLKGAVKLALTWHVLRNNRNLLEEFRKRVQEDIKNHKKNHKRTFYGTNEFLNGLFRFDPRGINTDYFRFLRISDSQTLKTQVVVHDVGIFYVARPNTHPRTFSLEFVPINRDFVFDVRFVKEEYDYFLTHVRKHYRVELPKSIEEIFSIVNEFYSEVFKFEKERFEKAKENFKGFDTSKIEERFQKIEKVLQSKKYVLIHVGYGGGLMANSLFILLDEETRKQVRNIIKNHGKDEAPLTRRYLVQSENNSYRVISPIGWCALWLEDSQST
ncbi:MAG TPA: type III-A CRISPR-associated RAMP protein Csm5 [Thermotoga sp.]|uniref:type III-A CRISPR-associated RAMP protein Csm5 n=1 Tax=Thermotoga sp. (strain RQ2) TaxID=126740 RepID=UPI000160170D|nr:type III-A CRISPR-associated RAMP protein Csm5 [Thermotoga sp. RQ2]ACB09363.1 CRISPR-associated RAMP protein, Csm5 family [Thermotoga sp. RQ2]HBF69039.1 type III-A CRISPR-associated RAMP protein Csm5 [Thermotoga sp.]